MFQHYNSFGVVHLFMFLLLEVPCHHCFVSVSINRLLAHQHQVISKSVVAWNILEGLVIHTISRYTCPAICRIWSTRQKNVSRCLLAHVLDSLVLYPAALLQPAHGTLSLKKRFPKITVTLTIFTYQNPIRMTTIYIP
jgi:hypothetical protein